MPTFETQNKTDLYLTGDIGFDISAKNFIKSLQAVNTPNICVHIDSLGGNVFDGLSIYNALKDYTGKKTAIIEGVCASAASYILMAFDEVIAKANALLMIHNPLVENVSGNANELLRVSSTLAELSKIYIDAYSERTHLSYDSIKKMMDDETYFNAQQAKEKGFVDIIEGEQSVSLETLTAQAKLRLVAYAKHLSKPNIQIMAENPNEKLYTVEEAQAVLESAKEVNTQQAYKIAREQIADAISDIKDKSPFDPILQELDSLIVPEVKEEEQEQIKADADTNADEQPAEEEETTEEEPAPLQDEALSPIELEQKRKQEIKAFADEINKDGSLNELIIEALLSNMSLEDFKTESCKRLATANAKRNFKAALFATAHSSTPTHKTFKSKRDYIAHYESLLADEKTAEAKAFAKKYPNIF